jgi:phage shock protein PspC (stress-responsive transcriptional regulator)
MSIFVDRYGWHSTPFRPWIGGVCAGLAGVSGAAPWIIRLVAVILLLWHPLWILALYAVATVLLRREDLPAAHRWHWFDRRPAPSGGPAEPGLAALAQRLAALDRRLAALEAMIGASDYRLRQNFRNL